MLHPVEIAQKLYAMGIIDDATRNQIRQGMDKDLSDASGKLVDAVQTYIKYYPSENPKPIMERLFDILAVFDEYVPLGSVAQSLKREYLEETEKNEMSSCSSNKVVEKEAHDFVSGRSSPLRQRSEELKKALKFYMHDLDTSGINFDSAITLMKSRIEIHIVKSLEDGISPETLEKELQDLYMECLIPADINQWCFDKLGDCKKTMEPVKENIVNTSPDDVQPLFCKDVVYHSSVCSLVISAFKFKSETSFSLDNLLNSQGHEFNNLSVSSDKRFLMAQKEEVVYIAFAAVGWDIPRDHEDEMDSVIECLPLRYFTELLNQGKRLVFTGFSVCGFLARAVVLKLWETTLIPASSLSNNVTCILFGPFYVQNCLIKYPQLLKTLHSFFIKDDALPKLSVWLPTGHLMMGSNIEELKHYLMSVRRHTHIPGIVSHENGYFGNAYMLTKDMKSSYWEKLDVHSELYHVTEDYISKLSEFNLSQHKMEVYQVSVQRGFLEKGTPYSVPLANKNKRTSDIQSLKPKLDKVEVNCQQHPDGKEVTLTFEGDNLWFCSKLEVFIKRTRSPLVIPLDARNLSKKQIQYCHGEDNNAMFSIAMKSITHTNVKVTSLFCDTFEQNVQLTFKEPDPISFRQSQLAKQNPSEIIQLSFLSALLELSPHHQNSSNTSERYQLITSFLQEAARIVPLEGILFAIASCSSDLTVSKCVEAAVNSNAITPCSKLMQVGYQKAFQRLRTGIPSLSSSYDLVEEVSYLSQYHRFSYNEYPEHSYDQQVFYDDFPGSAHGYHYNQVPLTDMVEIQRRSFGIPYGRYSYSRHNVHLAQNISPEEKFLSLEKRFRFTVSSSKLICGRNIGEIYPITEAKVVKTLPVILHEARSTLADLSFHHRDSQKGVGNIHSSNSQMLRIVNNIIKNDLEPCVSMLGGFMEQQIRIPLVNNPKDTAEAFFTAETSGAVGVWALFALDRTDIETILQRRSKQTFVVQIAQFIQGVLNEAVKREHHQTVSSYDGKLQFLLQGLTNTVSCSSHYISYTLERELVLLCSQFKITPTSKVFELIMHWDVKFKETALALVPDSHRPLVARWMIWALNIHQLREGLAKYISIGVIGLVNSGKSTLVKKIFRKETVSGTFQSARTTVPFIYNMDNSIQGLSVIDFPGVDDRDESIKGLAKLLVGLAQVVIFVCSYDKFHTMSAKEWSNTFQNELSGTPVLVCLTNADKLCEDESCIEFFNPESDKFEADPTSMAKRFQLELKSVVNQDPPAHCTVRFCTLTQNSYSPLRTEKSQEAMRKVGIFTPKDIGGWIVGVVGKDLQQPDLAERLSTFFKMSV